MARGSGQLETQSTVVSPIMYLSKGVLGQLGIVQHSCICIIGLHHLYKWKTMSPCDQSNVTWPPCGHSCSGIPHSPLCSFTRQSLKRPLELEPAFSRWKSWDWKNLPQNSFSGIFERERDDVSHWTRYKSEADIICSKPSYEAKAMIGLPVWMLNATFRVVGSSVPFLAPVLHVLL